MVRLLSICFLVVSLLLPFSGVKAVDYTEMSEKITFEEGKDTVWIINTGFNLYKQKLHLTLDFSKLGFELKDVDWEGRGNNWVPVGDLEQPHIYEAGRHELRLRGMDGKVRYCMVFNKMLSTDFKLDPDPFRYCFEKGGDSLLIVREHYEDNPPGTQYNIKITVPGPIEDSITTENFYTVSEWFGPKADSTWIVFKHQTGVAGGEIAIEMKYQKEGIDLEEETNPQKFFIYRAPNVKKIFGFYPTKLEDGMFVDLCANTTPEWLELSTERLAYYQCKLRSSTPVPYYKNHQDKQGLEIHYYYSDTLYKKENVDTLVGNWREVSGKADTVSDNAEILFKMPGYYKMMITAQNICNEEGGMKIDTLWTDKMEGEENKDKRRYIRVYSYDTTKIVCKTETVCRNKSDNKIKIVDYSVRRGYEALPKYVFSAPGYNIDMDATIVDTIWKSGQPYKRESIGNIGCDSTVFYITLNKPYYGELKLNVSKETHCDNVSCQFSINVGINPEVNQKSLLLDLEQYGFVNGKHCDAFEYTMPLDTLSLAKYTKGFPLDSVYFYIKQGLGAEDTLIYRQADSQPLTYLFDSTEVNSRIRICSYNVCGASEGSLDISVHEKPKLDLLRDSVFGNDSLCVGIDYPYYWSWDRQGKVKDIFYFTLKTDGKIKLDGEPKDSINILNGTKVQYINTGEYTEAFSITNKQMPSCSLEIQDQKLTILALPDTLLYPDTVNYCAGSTELNTGDLFAPGKSDFEWGEWQLNAGEVRKERLPVFNLNSERKDTLHYKLSRSKGCYVKGELELRPQDAPVLILDDRANYCLPDTIDKFRDAGFVQSISPWDGHNYLTVYENKVREAAVRYQEPNILFSEWPLGEKSERLIYKMENIRVDANLMGKCRVLDTVELAVSAPRLQVLKNDTLIYPWTKYDFSRMKGHIDTLALDKASLRWTLRPDRPDRPITGLFEPVYTLEETEKNRDTLLFEVSARNYCGEELKDTLYLRLNRLKLKAYKDTICSNTEGYRLWDKVEAAFADPSTVEWDIVYPNINKGTLTGNGVDVTYTPDERTKDSVRITLTAALLGAPGVTDDTTIVLKINPAPVLSFSKDTLWACGRRINLNEIPAANLHKANIKKDEDDNYILYAGDYILKPGEQPRGRWNGSDYTFEGEHLDTYSADLFQRVYYEAAGLPGCKDVRDTVVLAQPVPARVTFKRAYEEMCANDKIRLDTLYTLTGEDRFVRYDWSLASTSWGRYENGHYVASAPEDQTQELVVKTYKEYTCYNGSLSPKGELQTEPVSLPLTVHRAPVFSVVHRYDTLCRDQEEIKIMRDWVKVGEGCYPDYKDSVRVNGIRLGNDNLIYGVPEKGRREKLVVTVAQGRCTKWTSKSDTIYLYRLPDMLSGSFSVEDVCEGGQGKIVKSHLEINPLVSNVTWTATGGTVTADNEYFVPDNEMRNAYVHLTVTAPHGCEPEKIENVQVTIGRKPRLQTKAYTVCRVQGQTQQIAATMKDPTVTVKKIDWYRVGTPDAFLATTAENEPEWTFTVADADTAGTELMLRAAIQSDGACQGIYNDTVRITWQEPPSFSVQQPIKVCQADPEGIDLSSKVQVFNAGQVEWNLQTTAAGRLEGSVFVPGEFFGSATVEVRAPGLAGCLDETRPVPVTVDEAPQSGISPSGEHCTRRQVELKPGNVKAQHYKWNFGDGTSEEEGGTVRHTYSTAGEYTVSMTARFANGCARTEQYSWAVNPTPQALFNLPNPAPINKPVTLTSISMPETVSCKWTVDAASNYSLPEATHIFTTAGDQQVRLVVISPENCTDTLTKSTVVLDVPVAKFDVEVDSCGRKVKIINHSTRNRASVAWDFGNGQSVSHDENPADQSYSGMWKDTLYTIRLTLANVSDTVEYTRTVKMISELKPDFEIWANDYCNKTEKEIRILTKGKAETTYVDWGDGSTPEQWQAAALVQVLSHTYPTNMTTSTQDYTITLRSENTCHQPDPVTRNISVVPVQARAKVLADEGERKKCYGDSLAFWNKSFGFISRGYTCEWNFGDGTPLVSDTASVQPVKHKFERPGTYTVRLRVKDECDELVDTEPVVVYGNDSLDFAFSKDKMHLCTGDSVRIWLVQKGEAPFTKLRWSLPDGTRRRDEDTISYVFKEPGSELIVRLSAVADNCPEEQLSRSCVVQQTPQPIIRFTRNPVDTVGCTPLSIPFLADNGKGGTDGMHITWDFDDGSASVERRPPVKVFADAGEYRVRMSMESPEGCVGRDSLLVTAKATPDARLELSRHLVCSDEGSFEIKAFNRTLSPEECTFEWYKGNEVFSMAPDSIAVPFVGFHGRERIALRAKHRLSECEDWMNDTIVASWELKAALSVSPDTVCEGMEVVFRDTSASERGTCRFLFDDGSIEEVREVSRLYQEAGKYGYRFVQSNADGCTDTLRGTVYVHSLPVAEFDWMKDNSLIGTEIRDGVVLPEKDNGGIRFTNASQAPFLDGENQELHYHWDFGDGESSREKDPLHRFDNNGFYDVWLHAVSNVGCRDSVMRTVAIETVKGLYFPNAIMPASPDEGVNRFQPKGVGLYALTLKIYAPTGNCVWQTDKIEEGRPAEYWDGTYNGEIVPAGVYTWEASAVFIDGSVQNRINGILIVVR